MKYLIIDLILKLVYLGINTHLNYNWDLFVWSVFILVQPVLLSLAIKEFIINPKIKIVNFVVLITSTAALTSFIAEWFLYEHYKNVSTISNIILTLVVIPLSLNAVSRVFAVEAAKYKADKSYIAFKKPRNIFGFIVGLFNSPYGHCSLVTKGREFAFSKGVLIEKKYIDSDNVCLKKIKTVPLYEARKITGSRWGLFNNCLTVFNKFK